MKHRGHPIDLQAIIEADTDPYQIDGLTLATVVDIGANIGTFTDRVMRNNPECQVWAYEPEIGNCNLLVANTKQYPTVKQYNMAVWSHLDGVTVQPNYGCSETSENRGLQPVASTTLNEIMGDLSPIDLLKCDTEGAEFHIFPAASPEMMSKIGRIRMEIHYDQGDEVGLREFLSQTHHLVFEDIRPQIGGYWFWDLIR